MTSEQTKHCPYCNETKPVNEFGLSNHHKDNLRTGCKKCEYIINRKWLSDHPTEKRRLNWKQRGILEEELELVEQAYLTNVICYICGNEFKNDKDKHADHNHLSGKFRAFLCRKCNLLLGASNENPEILFKAIEYLKKYSEGEK